MSKSSLVVSGRNRGSVMTETSSGSLGGRTAWCLLLETRVVDEKSSGGEASDPERSSFGDSWSRTLRPPAEDDGPLDGFDGAVDGCGDG
jgi:hypothetical protein